MQKKLKKYWKFLETGCILSVLFTALCVCAAEKVKPASVTVQLADPETESELAANKKELARLKTEVERLRVVAETRKQEVEKQKAAVEKLRTENIQKQTENAQKTAELQRLAKEKANLEAQLAAEKQKAQRSKDDLEAQLSASKQEIQRRKDEFSGMKVDLEAELTVLKRETKRRQDEINGLKAEIAKLKNDASKSTTELQAENSLLAETNQNLRNELLDTLERCARLSDRVKRMEQSAAGVLETLAPVYAGVRETELAEALDLTTKSGMKLVAKSTNVCEMLYPKIEKLGLADVDKARLRVALDALSAENQRFARLSVPSVLPEQFKKCRVLEVCEKPEVIILNAGYRDGVRVNMSLQAGTDASPCVLRVVAVRSFVAAAVVVKGNGGELGVGQEVRAMQ